MENHTYIDGAQSTEIVATDDYTALKDALMVLQKQFFYTYIVLGLFGNFMTFLISISKENRKISVCVYMCGLSIVDSIVLIDTFLYRILFNVDKILSYEDVEVKTLWLQ